MNMSVSGVVLCGSIALTFSAAIQSAPSAGASSFSGNWKLNAQKSDVTGDKLVIKRLSGR